MQIGMEQKPKQTQHTQLFTSACMYLEVGNNFVSGPIRFGTKCMISDDVINTNKKIYSTSTTLTISPVYNRVQIDCERLIAVYDPEKK